MPETKSIGLVTPTYIPETAGSTVYFEQVANILKRSEDYEPYIITEYSPTQAIDEVIDGIRVIRLCSDEPHIIKEYGTPPDYIEKNYTEIDLWHIHTHTSGVGTIYRSVNGLETPFLYDFRDPGAVGNDVMYGRNRHYMSINEEIDSLIRDKFDPYKIFRSPVHVDVTDVGVCKSTPPEKFRCIFAGSMHNHKGMDVAIQSVLKTSIDAELLIFGSGPEEDRISRKVRGLDDIHYMGEVPHDTLLAEIASSDVLLAPFSTEGDPRVVIEAIKLDTPVIGTEAGSIPDIVGDAGIIIDDKSELFASAIENVDNNYDSFARIAKLSVYSICTDEEFKNNIMSAYNEILNTIE